MHATDCRTTSVDVTPVLGKNTREGNRTFMPFMGILIYPLISDSRIRILRTKCNQSRIVPEISHIFFLESDLIV